MAKVAAAGGGGTVAVAAPHPPRPASEGFCFSRRGVLRRRILLGWHRRGSAAAPHPALMATGRVVARVLLRPVEKRSAIR